MTGSSAVVADVSNFGSFNFNQIGTTVNNRAIAVIVNGNCGLTRSHNCAPIHGAGSETMPKLVLNNPNAVPRKCCGTDLLIND